MNEDLKDKVILILAMEIAERMITSGQVQSLSKKDMKIFETAVEIERDFLGK